MRNGNYCISAHICSYSESPERPGNYNYYTSLERYFKREYKAIEIIENGPVVVEEIQKQD